MYTITLNKLKNVRGSDERNERPLSASSPSCK